MKKENGCSFETSHTKIPHKRQLSSTLQGYAATAAGHEQLNGNLNGLWYSNFYYDTVFSITLLEHSYPSMLGRRICLFCCLLTTEQVSGLEQFTTFKLASVYITQSD